MEININKIKNILNSQSEFKNKYTRDILLKVFSMFLVCAVVHMILTRGLHINIAASLLICVDLFLIIFIAIGKILTYKIKKCPLVNAEVISCEKVEVRGDLYNDLQFKYYDVSYSFFYNNEQRVVQSPSEKKIKVGKKTRGYYDEKNNTYTDESVVKQYFISKVVYVIIVVLLIIAGIIIIYPMIEENTISRESLINGAFPIICVILTLAGISVLKSAKNTANLKKNSEKITATIVDFTFDENPEGDFSTNEDDAPYYCYHTKCEYFYNGKKKTYISEYEDEKPIVGNTVELMINPENGDVIEENDASHLFFIGAVGTFFPLTLLVLFILFKYVLN